MLAWLAANTVTSSFQASLDELRSHDMARPGGPWLTQWAKVRADSSGIPDGRDKVAAWLLESDAEWLLFIDSDMGFAGDSLDRLISAADPKTHPIVGALCFVAREVGDDGMGGRRVVPYPTIFDFVDHDDGVGRFTAKTHFPVDQVVRVGATGMAFVVIHRSVVERVHTVHGPTWFQRVRSPDGWLGEDISFFVRTAALHIPAHVHTGVVTTHQKTWWVSDRDFWLSFDAPPATELVQVLCDGEPDPTLVASTGLARWGDSEVEKIPDFIPASWVVEVKPETRFHPGWLDHVQHVAGLYGAQVVQAGAVTVFRRSWADEHGTGDKSIRRSKHHGVFQVAAGARVE